MPVGHICGTTFTAPSLRSWHCGRVFQIARHVHTASTIRCRKPCHIRAQDERDDGDFGARDPFPEEVASDFGNKTLGNYDTMHNIRVPEGMRQHVGLSSKKCVPCEAGKVKALSEAEANAYRNQVQGWRLVKNSKGDQCLRQDWKVKNFKAGLEAFGRIGQIAEEEGHHPDLHLEGYNGLTAELSTHSVGGLTENDFVMAAKINKLDFSDLQQQKKRRTFFV